MEGGGGSEAVECRDLSIDVISLSIGGGLGRQGTGHVTRGRGGRGVVARRDRRRGRATG